MSNNKGETKHLCRGNFMEEPHAGKHRPCMHTNADVALSLSASGYYKAAMWQLLHAVPHEQAVLLGFVFCFLVCCMYAFKLCMPMCSFLLYCLVIVVRL